jgi:hypothetical protein
MHLHGAGIGSTVITSSIGSGGYLITYSPSSPGLDTPFEMDGLELNGAESSGVFVIEFGGSTPITKLKIHDNKFRNTNGRAFSEKTGIAFGVVYSNQWVSSDFAISTTPGCDCINPFNVTHVLGDANSLFFEDNSFDSTSDTGADNFIFEQGQSGRLVFRHNTIIKWPGFDMWDAHGDQPSGVAHGTVSTEIYRNTVTVAHSFSMRAAYIRGGQHVIANNAITTSASTTSASFGLTEEETWRSDISGTGGTCPCPAPFHDQATPSYSWNNTFGGVNSAMSLSNGNDTNAFTLNTNWWKPTAGLAASLPGTCTTGDFYGATDQDKLWKCTSTNTWTVWWTPYTYPHPLRAEAAAGTSRFRLRIRGLLVAVWQVSGWLWS